MKAIPFIGLLLILIGSASAYTGSFGVFPSIAGGPGSTTVTNLDIDTVSNNPQTITPSLFYVYQIVVETNPPIQGTNNLLIKEEPYGQTPSFSFTVPTKINNDLVQATVTIWAPDSASLTIEHYHQGEPTQYLTATKVSPTVTDAYGNVLWSFTTTSFSDFRILSGKGQERGFPWLFLGMLTLICASCIWVLRR